MLICYSSRSYQHQNEETWSLQNGPAPQQWYQTFVDKLPVAHLLDAPVLEEEGVGGGSVPVLNSDDHHSLASQVVANLNKKQTEINCCAGIF